MDLRLLGSSDVSVSPVGLGGFELGGGNAANHDPSLAQATEVIEAALAAGINWLDTSEQYYDTRNETVISATRCST